MDFYETRIGRIFFDHQMPQLIRSLQVIAEKLSAPAPVIRFPTAADTDILTRLYYGDYEPENFIRTKRTAQQNDRSRTAYDALAASLPEASLTLLRTYSDAMIERESDSAALAYQSGFRVAVQLIAAGLSTPERPEQNKYRMHFTYQLTSQKNLQAEDLRRWLARYKELTGLEYLSWFEEERYADHATFALLVDTGIIDLWQYFNAHVSDHPSEYEAAPALYHVQEYAMGASTRLAFSFLEMLMKAYSFQMLRHIWGCRFKFHERFLSGSLYAYQWDHVCLQLRRDCLSPDEERQLYEWVDRSVFCMEPEMYPRFVKIALKDQYVQTLFDKSELCQVLKAGIAAEIFSDRNYETTELKEAFFSEEDRAADRAARELAQAEEKRLQEEQELAQRTACLEETFNGTVFSLVKFINRYSGADRQSALRLAYDRLTAAMAAAASFDTARELGDLLLFCGAMLKAEALPREELLSFIKTVIQEGENDAAHG